MRALADIEARLEALARAPGVPREAAGELLALGEECLENWITARGGVPGEGRREGFRLLTLHRQGARGEPSFNACRETCREIVYRCNLITLVPARTDAELQARLAARVALHLSLFVRGKLEQSALGEFCCSSKPRRAGADA